MNTILTSDRPVDKLHLERYVGSLRERVGMQADLTNQLSVMIVDLQALTDSTRNPEKVSASVLEVTLGYLAVGLDPTKTTIFIQSQVPQLAELTMYYLSLMTTSCVRRNPTVKVEIEQKKFGEGVPTGFFMYPISQAADITALQANLVSAGGDQKPTLEQAQETAHSFSQTYGRALVRPEAVLPPKGMRRLPGIDGSGKMSKSLNNGIYLPDPAEVVQKKVISMYTSPDHIHIEGPGQVEGNMVFIYLDIFGKSKEYIEELEEHYHHSGSGDVKVKRYLIGILEEELAPIRRRHEELVRNPEVIMEMLHKGSLTAGKVAARTLTEVKEAIGIQYF